LKFFKTYVICVIKLLETHRLWIIIHSIHKLTVKVKIIQLIICIRLTIRIITVFFSGLIQMNAQRVWSVWGQHQTTSKRQCHVFATFPQHGNCRTVLNVVQWHAVGGHNPVVNPTRVREKSITVRCGDTSILYSWRGGCTL